MTDYKLIRVKETTHKKINKLKKKLQKESIGKLSTGDAVEIAVSEKMEAK